MRFGLIRITITVCFWHEVLQSFSTLISVLCHVPEVLNRPCFLSVVFPILFLLLLSTMFFNLSRPYLMSSIILLYNKEAVLRTLCSLPVSASHIPATSADTVLYNLLTVFLKHVFIFNIYFSFKYFWFVDKCSTFIYYRFLTPN